MFTKILWFILQTILSAALAFAAIAWAVSAYNHHDAKPKMVTMELAIPPYRGHPHTYKDLEDMARNVYYESRGQPETGQIAVAYVVLNRLDYASEFPHSIHEIIYQRRPVCQFSWVCQPSYPVRDLVAWNQALIVSQRVLEGRVDDPTSGCIFFHTTNLKMGRGDVNLIKIQDHVFYSRQVNEKSNTRKPAAHDV